MKFEEWVKGIENAAIKGLCSTHPNICKMIYNEGQKDIEKALKDKGVCLQSEYDELKQKVEGYERTRDRLKEIGFPTFMSCKEYAEQINKMKCCQNCKHSEEDNKSSTICDECFELCYWEMKE
jgi:hypothetical protein